MNSKRVWGSMLIAWACSTAAVAADSGMVALTLDDNRRLEQYDTTRAAAISEARQGGSADDLKVLDHTLSGDALPFNNVDLSGQWRCRIIKVGGNLPLTVYPWFDCRIRRDSVRYYVEKLTGSQRTSGWLAPRGDNRFLYVGAGHYRDEKPRAYGLDSQQNQVAYVYRRGASRLVFEFPDPQFESKLDLLVLERR